MGFECERCGVSSGADLAALGRPPGPVVTLCVGQGRPEAVTSSWAVGSVCSYPGRSGAAVSGREHSSSGNGNKREPRSLTAVGPGDQAFSQGRQKINKMQTIYSFHCGLL